MFAFQTFFLSLVYFSVFVVEGILLGSTKVFGSRFLRLSPVECKTSKGVFLLSCEGFVSSFA